VPGPTRYRNVFFFVGGLTPQVITETLFFFLVRHRPAIRPHEIHVLTTTEGQKLILGQLLDPHKGRFYCFCQDYRLNPRAIHFSAQTVEVLQDKKGEPLSDIRTDADNRAAADQIAAKVRTLTADPHTRLLASVAGGRKTMGLYLGFALQFYGRPQDRLTHVLVSPPELESSREFFYPSAQQVSFATPHGSIPSRAATVTVAEVPFILLGHKLPVLQDRSDLGYAALVAQSQREVDLLSTLLPLTVDRVGRQLRVGESLIELSGLEFVIYYLVARRRQQAPCAPVCLGCEACTVGTADFLNPDTIRALEEIAAEVGVRDPRLRELSWWTRAGDEGKKRFLQVCARIKRKVRHVLGEASGPYTIAPLQTRQGRVSRYTISLSKGLIRFS
jgi:CRISPR-associated protein (TIGR02584 family)